MTERPCEYPKARGGCEAAGTVEIKARVLDENEQEIGSETIGWLCQPHGVELLSKQLRKT